LAETYPLKKTPRLQQYVPFLFYHGWSEKDKKPLSFSACARGGFGGRRKGKDAFPPAAGMARSKQTLPFKSITFKKGNQKTATRKRSDTKTWDHRGTIQKTSSQAARRGGYWLCQQRTRLQSRETGARGRRAEKTRKGGFICPQIAEKGNLMKQALSLSWSWQGNRKKSVRQWGLWCAHSKKGSGETAGRRGQASGTAHGREASELEKGKPSRRCTYLKRGLPKTLGLLGCHG